MSRLWNPEEVRALALSVAPDPGAFEVLSHREWRWVLRCPAPPGGSVILKLWSRPGIKGRLRQRLGVTCLDHEWRSLTLARELGVTVPEPLGRSLLPDNPASFTEALVSADLGPCQQAVFHVKSLIARGFLERLAQFEDDLIGMTVAMIRGGLLDTDHGLVNTVVPENGHPVRLDFEMSRRVSSTAVHPWAYGAMLGHLLTTYTFAVQPDVQRTVEFEQRLVERLAPPRAVLFLAHRYLARRMEVQRQRIGLDVQVPWPR